MAPLAFSSGYIDRPVREELHPGDGLDPTDATAMCCT
jgi:hypothetical protein